MRIAVLGCGSIGRRHLCNLLALGHRDLLGYEPDGLIRDSLLAELSVPCTADLNEVWAWNPATVLVTAPSQVHLSLARVAAERGCHLFIEKPLSHTEEGAEALCDLVDRNGLTTMVACNMRFHPGPATVYRLLREEAIGRILAARIHTGSYLPRWRPAQDYRKSYSASVEWGGAVLDCIHELDLALWYFGPARLLAAATLPAENLGLATDGLAEILLRHDSGTLASVHLNFVQHDYRRCCQVIGSHGTISWDYELGCVVVYGADGRVAARHPQPDDWLVNRMYFDELAHFLDAVVNRTTTMNPIRSGLATLQIALAARKWGASE